jgi:hypothetical protein
MQFGQKTLGAAVTGGLILAASPTGAQEKRPLVELLKLPESRVSLFNRVSNTAITIECKQEASSAVCDVRAMSNTAQIDMTQRYRYSVGSNGALQVRSEGVASRPWTQDTFNWNYKPARDAAMHITWDKTQGMGQALFKNDAHAVQNDVMKLSQSSDIVTFKSHAPVSDNHGLGISVLFNQSAKTVQMQLSPVALYNGAVVESQNAQGASRPFNSYDQEHYDRYSAQLNGNPSAYVMRR